MKIEPSHELPSSCVQEHSPETEVRSYSVPDTTEFWTVAETPWRNCCDSGGGGGWGGGVGGVGWGELLTRWSHEVSRCHSSFSRRLGVRNATDRGGSATRRLRARLLLQDSARDHSQFVPPTPTPHSHTHPLLHPPPPTDTDGGGSSPMEASGSPALWQRLQIFRPLAADGGGGAGGHAYPPPLPTDVHTHTGSACVGNHCREEKKVYKLRIFTYLWAARQENSADRREIIITFMKSEQNLCCCLWKQNPSSLASIRKWVNDVIKYIY